MPHWFAGSLIDAIKLDTKNIIMVLQEFRISFIKTVRFSGKAMLLSSRNLQHAAIFFS
jgi:hypothetical protein